MKTLALPLTFLFCTMISGCTSLIHLRDLQKLDDPSNKVMVSSLRYERNLTGLEPGEYVIEYENSEGYFYKGPDLPVLMAIGATPSPSKLTGGVFVPKTASSQTCRIYYYADSVDKAIKASNYPSTPGNQSSQVIQSQVISQANRPSNAPLTAGINAGLGGALAMAMIAAMENDRGEIILRGPTSEVNICSYVSKK